MPVKILLPVNDSDESRQGVKASGIFADAIGADITLVHALYPELFRFILVPELFSGSLMEKERAISDSVLKEASEALADYGVKTKTLALEGRPEDIVSKLSDGFDLLVLGTKIHSDLWEVLVGSIPSELIRIVKKPIMVVKHGGSLPQWPRAGGKLNILCALDHSPLSERVVRFLERIGSSDAVSTTLLHVVDQIELGVDLMGAEERFNTLSRAHQGGMDLLAGYSKRLAEAGIETKTIVAEGHAAETAIGILGEEDYDFILSGRPTVGDITQRVFDSMCHHLFHHTLKSQIIIS